MLAHCGERAASLLRSNPDKEALGFFIPSVVGCGPLLKMRGLHASAALGRNRKNAGRPSGSQQYASPEQPVALVARLSQSYGDANYKATGKHAYSGDGVESWYKAPKSDASHDRGEV